MGLPKPLATRNRTLFPVKQTPAVRLSRPHRHRPRPTHPHPDISMNSMRVIAPAANKPLRAGISVCILLLVAGWIIQIVSLGFAQANLDGREVTGVENVSGVFPFVGMGVGRGASSYLSFDWFLVAFFFFVNLLALAVLAKDTRTGSVVKYRIPCSVYAAIAAVFATIRINDLAFATGVMSSSAKALLASYFIQVVPYYIIPFLNGTSFLDTVASRPADVPPMAAEQGYPAAAAHGYPVAHKPEVVGARVPVV